MQPQDKRVSQLDPIVAVALDDFVLATDNSPSPKRSRRIALPRIFLIIPLLPEMTLPTTDDELVIYDESGSIAQRIKLLNGLKIINSAPEKDAPDAGDVILTYSVGDAAVRKMTGGNWFKGVDNLSAQTTIQSGDYVLLYNSTTDEAVKIRSVDFLKAIVDTAQLNSVPARDDEVFIHDTSNDRPSHSSVENFWRSLGSLVSTSSLADGDTFAIVKGNNSRKITAANVSSKVQDDIKGLTSRPIIAGIQLVGFDNNVLGSYDASQLINLGTWRNMASPSAISTSTSVVGNTGRIIRAQFAAGDLDNIGVGAKVRFMQGGVQKYGVITYKTTSGTLYAQILLRSDSSLATSAISQMQYVPADKIAPDFDTSQSLWQMSYTEADYYSNSGSDTSFIGFNSGNLRFVWGRITWNGAYSVDIETDSNTSATNLTVESRLTFGSSGGNRNDSVIASDSDSVSLSNQQLNLTQSGSGFRVSSLNAAALYTATLQYKASSNISPTVYLRDVSYQIWPRF